MGAIWFKRAELVGAASDTVGYKAGLAVSRDDLVRHTEEIGLDDWWQGDDDGMLRVRSEEFEEAIEQLLYSVGNIPVPRVIRPEIGLFHRYRENPDDSGVLTGMLDILKSLPTEPGKPVDLTLLLTLSEKQFGAKGLRMALEYVDGLELYLHANPWTKTRRKSWKDVAELKALFESASLLTQYGTFIDQRYIDYHSCPR